MRNLLLNHCRKVDIFIFIRLFGILLLIVSKGKINFFHPLPSVTGNINYKFIIEHFNQIENCGVNVVSDKSKIKC